MSSAPQPPQRTEHTSWHGEYLGSCYLPATQVGALALETVRKFSESFGSLRTPEHAVAIGKGKRRITASFTDKSFKVTDAGTWEIMQQLDFDNILTVDRVEKKIIYTSRSLDARLSVKIAHLISVANGASLVNAMKTRIKGIIPKDVCMVTGETADVSVIMAYYLGFVKVPQSKGSTIVQGAIKLNREKRGEQEDKRIQRKLPKSSLLMGCSKTDDFGTHVSEHPVVIVMSGRSARFIDIVTGETISKFFLKQITFQGPVVYRTKPDMYGMIMHNHRLGVNNCHMFTLHAGEGKVLHKMLSTALKLVNQQLSTTQSTERRSVFSALEGYEREKAPDDLYRKQIRRGHLIADKVLGAGEYGEVYLATQKNVLDGKTKKVVSKERAVKLLKAGANKSAKDEFIRECQMLMKCEGPGVVRMIGVAVQQAPWLCVLEYMQYGDLRTFLKTAKSKNITLETREELDLCIQLARGCSFISKARVVHMDLAARNVLLGQNNLVKIADFGMSRSMDAGQNHVRFDAPIRVAIKWTAMEAMMENIFSEASDCWSLGVVFWEICTMGAMPYAHVSNMDMLYYLIGGERVMAPIECPDDLWEIMYKCWEEDPGLRWKISDLVVELETLLPKYPLLRERDLGKYVVESTGEERIPSPGPKKDEPKYVYDVPLPNEDTGYDLPLEDQKKKKKKKKKKKNTQDADTEPAVENEDDAYDIPLDNTSLETKTVVAEESEANAESSGGDDSGQDEDAGDDNGEDENEDEPTGFSVVELDETDDGDISQLRSASEAALESDEVKMLERKQSVSAHKTIPRGFDKSAISKHSMDFLEEEEEEEVGEEEGEEKGEQEGEQESNNKEDVAEKEDQDAEEKHDKSSDADEEKNLEEQTADSGPGNQEEVILDGEFDEAGTAFGFGDVDADGSDQEADAVDESDTPPTSTQKRRNSVYDGFDENSTGPDEDKNNDSADSTSEPTVDNSSSSNLPVVPIPALPDRETIETMFFNSLKRGSALDMC